MSGKMKWKMSVDVLMTAGLLALMTYSFLGEELHEWLGIGQFLLYVLHHYLNRSWIKKLGRGAYTPYRTLQTVLAVLIFLSMTGSMLSGILISRYVIPRKGVTTYWEMMSLAHLFCAYWGFLLMSLHIGLHWRMILGVLRGKRNIPKAAGRLLRLAAWGTAAYGALVFYREGIASYLFLQTHFVMYDFDATLATILRDYLAMMGFFILLAFYAGGMIQKGYKKYKRKGAE